MANSLPVVLLLSLFISLQVHARDSQFFSKFTSNPDAAADPAWVGPSEKQAASLEKQAQDPPSFVAESGNGYGLYGHETGQLPPSEADSTFVTSIGDESKDAFTTEEVASDTKAMLQGSTFSAAASTEEGYDSRAAVNGQNNYFPAEDQGFRDTRLQGTRYTNGANYGNVVANGRNNYYTVGNRYTASANDDGVRQPQGMSDTRSLENGKYYYKIDDEEKYNPTRFADSMNTEFGTQQGYFPSKDVNSYEFGSRGNNYYAGNYPAENTNAVAGGGYEPVKEMEEFRATRNVDDEFLP